MNKILLAGNGFDLAHGLLTSYKDFLYVMKHWQSVYEAYKTIKSGVEINEFEPLYKYIVNFKLMDDAHLQKFDNIINNNSWVKYYCNCEAEIDLWIDFEREILPIMDILEIIFKSSCNTTRSGDDSVVAIINKSNFSNEMIRVLVLWDKYFRVEHGNNITIKAPYVSMRYGILKKKIMKDIRGEFDEFIFAFELYLCEFVHKRNDISILNQIAEINMTHVISFNYTTTEHLYGVVDAKSHHLHGKIRKDFDSSKNNMVVGVNEQQNQNIEHIYFVKYFQRIQKGVGIQYKSFVENTYENEIGECVREPFTLYIYGHSLDLTDEDVLRYVIGDIDNTGFFRMKPNKIIIFYRDDEDYAQKVINLIKLYGRPIVEKFMENESFEFVKIEVQ